MGSGLALPHRTKGVRLASNVIAKRDPVFLLCSAKPSGDVLRDFAMSARAAALSGMRLAVRTADDVEVYDTHSGMPAARFPAPSALGPRTLKATSSSPPPAGR